MMTTELFHLQITGVISSEEQEHEAISALANILIVPLSKAQQLFYQAPVIIKENIDHDTALLIESELQKHGIESQRMSSTDAPSSAGKFMDIKELDSVDSSGLSLEEEWASESTDHTTQQAIDDVHRYSHQGGADLSAYHLDELSLETITPDAEKLSEKQQAPEPYDGPERREDQRRKHDRRDMLRFEVEVKKNDRRKNDRRESDSMWTKNYDI